MERHTDPETLIAMADGTLSETRARLADTDPAAIAPRVLDEVVARAVLFEGPQTTVDVQFELHAHGVQLEYVVTVGQPTPTVGQGRVRDAPVVIRQDLAELLRAVYGTGMPRHDATRAVWIMNEPGPGTDDPLDPWLVELRAATLAASQIIRACSPYAIELGALCTRFGSDKWGDHFYTSLYERHLKDYRDERIRLLEIGVGGYESPELGGESLLMWKFFFRRGLVFGVDIFDKSGLDQPRVRTLCADQSDPASLRAVAKATGPLDIIIDDGSHISAHVITSFNTLFPHLVDGGLYVIEDLQTSYWPGWNGGSSDLTDPDTTVGFLKTLADGLHHQDQMNDSSRPPSAIDRQIRGIQLYHNIAFIEKGVNDDQTAPSWVRRFENDMDLTPKGSMRRRGIG